MDRPAEGPADRSADRLAEPAAEPPAPAGPRAQGPRVAASALLAYLVLVVLFGAVVRISGSGAGCGQHWPSCQGAVVRLPASTAELVEVTHRYSSGLLLAAGVAQWLAWRRHRDGAGAAARIVLWLLLVESLLGAVLVLFRLVEMDASLARAVVMPLHLWNTSLLLAGQLLVVWLTRGGSVQAARRALRTPRNWGLAFCFAVLAGTGAVTALGDTVFPVAPGSSAWASWGQEGARHFLQIWRLVHPAVALLGASVLGWLLWDLAERGAQRWAWGALGLLGLQLVVGGANVFLGAPPFLQVLHLALALLLWLASCQTSLVSAAALEHGFVPTEDA